MLRIPFPDLLAGLVNASEHLGLSGERAELCARLFAETTCDGVYTHGLNRFPRFAATIRNGSVYVHAEPVRLAVEADSAAASVAASAIERWDGLHGVGNLNAHSSMARAIELARHFGLGAVALCNTNHWMRGGSYGWQAADAGLFAICWTNTLPNLPAWGAKSAVLGNNPLVLAVPRPDGAHVVLDMAISQFSYGTLSAYKARGEQLPVPGGFDAAGELTRDPAAIEASQRALPVGYWKGSGLSLMLDLFAAMLSGGAATHQIPNGSLRESGVSQFFLAIDPSGLGSSGELGRIADGILASLHAAVPIDPAHPIRYPGEQTLRLRKENLRLGVPVEETVWEKVQSLNL